MAVQFMKLHPLNLLFFVDHPNINCMPLWVSYINKSRIILAGRLLDDFIKLKYLSLVFLVIKDSIRLFTCVIEPSR